MTKKVTTHEDRALEMNTGTNLCGVTMNDSVEGRAVAEVMEGKPGVTVEYYPAMIRIDAVDKLVVSMEEISEVLGYEVDPYVFQIEMSTHYGRMVILDDAVALYADFAGTMEFIE